MHTKKEKLKIYVTENLNKLYRLAFMYAKNEHDAEDVVNESIRRALDAIGQLEREEYMGTWLCRIVINTAISYVKSKELEKNYPDAHYGIDAGYIVKTDNEKYLSVDIYVVNTVGSSSTVHKFYNFDKTTGEVIHLKDIIKDDYIEDVAQIIETEIEKRNKEEGHEIYYATYDEIVELLNKKEEFYINENGKPVIVFDKYEIGIGAIGCPEFEINI